ncbi:DUF2177 family protein [Aquincola tertiaricarbonis]|uniref:DUF2177 family protein n=1 Tax=Aquincola tertiaricarbonis TaxID=391953 RepID=A0ABY4SAT9_AQUTE|nr:DUF2177 family protein [Aquincola tertiaricarbonis]URI09176.1 DUF2177 family protein [Aquincola tertiaricarbonis]
MPVSIIAYLGALLSMLALDAVWLGVIMPSVYQAAIGHLLLPEPRWGAAIVFYLAYPVGIVVFAVLPAFRAAMPRQAWLLGALYGALAYATYDLTNLATLQGWPVHIVVIDIAWGAFISAVAAACGLAALRRKAPALAPGRA